MIIDAILNLFFNIINFLIGLLPMSGFPVSIMTGIHNFFTSIYQYNGIFPIDTAFFLIGWAVTFWSIVLVWEIINWIIKMFRGN